ncbi:DUF2130 domain-containing protein [Planctomicrobium piriforme]|uniref:DUF2130 domain-containing protein n=1 Tax=Planctomicrobium piriforme TaxID=1576369 RepID=A0A1I3C6Y8_9PLAN|nr:DUF2130 domain-containing protein [Planctomicrobium piriforme]SFH69939.1 hypothetical protein SAMN05421753_102128 [Planctomicrobium piriforme]
MMDPVITCPSCKTTIKLTESLAAPLLEATREKYELAMAQNKQDIARRENAVREQQAAIEKAQSAIDDQVAEKLKRERLTIAAEEAKKARQSLGADLDRSATELLELKTLLKEREEKLGEAQKAQAQMLRQKRDLEEAQRELDLTIEKRVQESLQSTREKAKKEAEDELKLKVMEKQQTIESMQKQIEDLKRRAEQGSQQLQGEVLELELEARVRSSFPTDLIEPVPKGEHGGDLIQRICGPSGQPCGTLLWESKRTKNWSDGWLSKLREDQRAAKAEIAVIVTQALPKGVDSFNLIDGIWVTNSLCAIPLAIALRRSLIDISASRLASLGQQSKMEMVYQYLTGPRFRHRVEAIVEKFADMQDDLNKERKTMTKLWAKREEQIRCVVESTAGMYGDLQGIAGQSLKEIEGLEIETLTLSMAE